MQKGILNQQIFHKKSPQFADNVQSFVKETEKRMVKYDVKQYALLKRDLSDDRLEVIVIPASQRSAAQGLQSEGFSEVAVKNLNETSAYTDAEHEPVGVSFG